jgi:hypothetical protein
LLPAILQGVLWLNRTKLRVRSQLVILLFACLNLLLLLILRAQVDPYTGIYFWSSLVCSHGIGMRGGSREERMQRSRNHEELDRGHFIRAMIHTSRMGHSCSKNESLRHWEQQRYSRLKRSTFCEQEKNGDS